MRSTGLATSEAPFCEACLGVVLFLGSKSKEALGGRVSKFGLVGLKKFLDPECHWPNVVI